MPALFRLAGQSLRSGEGNPEESGLAVRTPCGRRSWLDNKECIILDYSETSLVGHWVRDEMRLVAPGLYLGKVYWGKKPLPVHFALEPAKTPSDTPDEKNG
jgi:hypothetical protein